MGNPELEHKPLNYHKIINALSIKSIPSDWF